MSSRVGQNICLHSATVRYCALDITIVKLYKSVWIGESIRESATTSTSIWDGRTLSRQALQNTNGTGEDGVNNFRAARVILRYYLGDLRAQSTVIFCFPDPGLRCSIVRTAHYILLFIE